MSDAVLTLNAGSSSLKFGLFTRSAGAPSCSADGEIAGIGTAPRFVARTRDGVVDERSWPDGDGLSHEDLLGELLDWVESHLGADRLAAAGHRIVHGGTEFAAPVRLDAAVLERLERLSPLAPLHQPHNLAAVRAVAALRPQTPQVACFDTAFHRGHAPEVDRFGLPRAWEAKGIRRYGFHGLSYEYILGRLRELDPALAERRLVVAHLGAGASLCAIAGGRSVDTTMGFTALDGLLMATRCGALDPGVVLHLARAEGLTPEAIEDLLYRRSGLLGVSQISSDMRELLASPDPRAAEAIDLFVFRIVREIGALTATMGGLNGLVFTAGVGERSPQIRDRVCARLAWLGVALDPAANARGAGQVSAADSAIAVWALPTDEDQMIARHTWRVLSA
jgi:acetate kinase